jgi:hypothetical protein
MSVELFGKELKEVKPGVLQLGNKDLDELYDKQGATKEVREVVRKASDTLLLEAAKVADQVIRSDDCEEPSVQVRLGTGHDAMRATVTGRKEVTYPDPDNPGKVKKSVKFGVVDLKRQVKLSRELSGPVFEQIAEDCQKAFK